MSSRGTRYWSSGSIPLIAPDVLGDIIASAGDIAVVISDMGEVLSVLINPNHSSFGSLDHWLGNDIRSFLTAESIRKLDTVLEAFANGRSDARAMELNHTDGATWDFPIRYAMHRIGPDGALLMLGRDLRPIVEMQQQLVKAQMALERDYEAQREFDTRFRVLMETTREAMVFVSLTNGRITEINSAAAALLGTKTDDLAGSAFPQEFENRRSGELMDSLTTAAIAEVTAPIELQARRSKRAVLLHPSVFRAAGERMLLCRMEAVDQADQGTDSLGLGLQAMYREGVEGIVFTDRDGVITSANESFLNLADVAHLSMVKGKSLADYMSRGSVDTKVLIENATRTGQMKLYSTKLVSGFGAQTSVEISATFLRDKLNPAMVFVMRDVSRVESARRAGAGAGGVSDEGARSVMELVGSAALKDIVSETTDVVEKMCIETAVELTRNNRVAAAEMLGLSRQSLYVKLRKYGLLNKD